MLEAGEDRILIDHEILELDQDGIDVPPVRLLDEGDQMPRFLIPDLRGDQLLLFEVVAPAQFPAPFQESSKIGGRGGQGVVGTAMQPKQPGNGVSYGRCNGESFETCDVRESRRGVLPGKPG